MDCLLECCLAMIKVSSKDCSSISGHLFKIILTIDGLSMNQDLQQSAYEALNLLAQALDLNEQDLFRQELGPALKSLKLECQDWTTNSFRVSVFSRLLTRSGPVVGHYPGTLIQGPLKKWTEHFLALHLLKIHSRGAPITPRGWMGVDFLDHQLL